MDTFVRSKRSIKQDFESSYWLVAMHTSDKERAFSAQQELQKWIFLPFCLCKAPARFEDSMVSILQGLCYDVRLVHMADISRVGENLRKLFQKFWWAQLKLNSKNSQLFQKDIWYLGLEGVIVDTEKLKTVQEWPLLKTEKCPSYLHLLLEVHTWIHGYHQPMT